jgi:DNA replication protein DnaC
VRTLDAFDFKFQSSVDQRLVRDEAATGRFVAQAENVVIFGLPGVGKTHLAVALGCAVVEAGGTRRSLRAPRHCSRPSRRANAIANSVSV